MEIIKLIVVIIGEKKKTKKKPRELCRSFCAVIMNIDNLDTINH